MSVSDTQLREWMVQVQAGNMAAYEQILETCASVTTRFLTRKQLDPIDQDDIIQEVLIAIHQAKHTYHPTHSCIGWIHAIIRFKLADFFRKKYKVTSHELYQELDLFLAEDCFETALEQAEGYHYLKHSLNALSPLQQQVITRLKLEGYSIKEVAIQLGITESNVKINAFRGFQKLQKLLTLAMFRCIFLIALLNYILKGTNYWN